MFHDYRMAKAVQEQKLRDAQRCLEGEQVADQAERPLREQIVARLVTLFRARARDARAVAKASKIDTHTTV